MRIRIVPLLALLCIAACSAASATAAPPSPTAGPTTVPVAAPTVGDNERWIEADLAAQRVRLHVGPSVMAEYVASAGVGTAPETTTYPGVFEVCIMMRGPIESAPGVYVRDVVEFDLEHHNGFHSQPMDEKGQILDARLGQPATAGCIRLAESAALFGFARLGMKVWVH